MDLAVTADMECVVVVPPVMPMAMMAVAAPMVSMTVATMSVVADLDEPRIHGACKARSDSEVGRGHGLGRAGKKACEKQTHCKQLLDQRDLQG